MTDFAKLLSKPADTIKRPPVVPAGTYNGVVSRHELGDQNKNRTPYVRYHLTLVSAAGPTSDDAALATIDLSKKQFRRDFFLTDDSLYRLKEFVESCGVATSGRALQELVSEPVGKNVLVDVQVGMGQQTNEPFNQIGNVKGA